MLRGDVPRMAIRNITYYSEGASTIHYWPLGESEGNSAADTRGGLSAEVENPDWLANRSQRLTFVGSTIMRLTTGITFDSVRQRVLLADVDSLKQFNLSTYEWSTAAFQSSRPLEAVTMVYDYQHDRIAAMFPGLGQISFWESRSNEWTSIDTLKSYDTDYHGHNPFVNPMTGEVMTVGGYGNYRTKNDLQLFDEAKRTWRIVQIKREPWSPRWCMTVGAGLAEDELILLGGEGNESGKQELGFHACRDIYTLNLRSMTSARIRFPAAEWSDYHFGRELVTDRRTKSIFALGSVRRDSVYEACVVRIELNPPSVKSVTNLIRSDVQWYSPRFFYNPRTDEFIAIVLLDLPNVGHRVQIYTVPCSSILSATV